MRADCRIVRPSLVSGVVALCLGTGAGLSAGCSGTGVFGTSYRAEPDHQSTRDPGGAAGQPSGDRPAEGPGDVQPIGPNPPAGSDRPPGPGLPGAPDPSLGSGGPGGRIEERYTAGNGLTGSYKAIIPSDIGPTKAYGLTIHLHGDGGGDYQWLFEDNARIGLSHGLIGVVVRAPNNKCCWYRGGEANAVFLDDLIQKELFARYNIDRRRVYFSGVSGGSQFLTGQFIPAFGAKYNSGAVMLCGGPANWLDSIQSTPTFIQQFRLYWYSSTGDFLYDQIEEGIAYYRQLGMNVNSEILPGGSHCDFDGGIDGALAAKLPLVLH